MIAIPVLKGTSARRILVNYRADAAVVQSKLPAPFRPKLYRGKAIIGVCLIRLENIRPAASLLALGISSENAAHRMAVEWEDTDGKKREGVFIPRRDTGSVMNHFAGGRLFPGQHHLASFHVKESGNEIDFHMLSCDKSVEVRVKGETRAEWPVSSLFPTLEEASAFFETGCLGYSVRCDTPRLDGLLLKTLSWNVESLSVSEVYSGYYGNEKEFPKGSVEFDHALLMRNIEHEWHSAEEPMVAATGVA